MILKDMHAAQELHTEMNKWATKKLSDWSQAWRRSQIIWAA